MRGRIVQLVILLTVCIQLSFAEETDLDPGTDRMRTLAHQTEVSVIHEDGSEETATQLAQPVFRYNDQPRSVHDATLWVWTDQNNRPVAVQKIEDSQHRGTGARRWTHCLSSLTSESIRVEWPEERSFQTRSPGLEFQAVPNASAPASSDRARTRQLRSLSRRFAAKIVIDPRSDDQLQLRLLPRPILEFGDGKSGLVTGAVFGFAAYGTNPDLLLIIELRPDKDGTSVWQYATARMTTGGLIVRYDEEVVWTAEWVRPVPAPFDSWTFFFVPQSEE